MLACQLNLSIPTEKEMFYSRLLLSILSLPGITAKYGEQLKVEFSHLALERIIYDLLLQRNLFALVIDGVRWQKHFAQRIRQLNLTKESASELSALVRAVLCIRHLRELVAPYFITTVVGTENAGKSTALNAIFNVAACLPLVPSGSAAAPAALNIGGESPKTVVKCGYDKHTQLEGHRMGEHLVFLEVGSGSPNDKTDAAALEIAYRLSDAVVVVLDAGAASVPSPACSPPASTPQLWLLNRADRAPEPEALGFKKQQLLMQYEGRSCFFTAFAPKGDTLPPDTKVKAEAARAVLEWVDRSARRYFQL